MVYKRNKIEIEAALWDGTDEGFEDVCSVWGKTNVLPIQEEGDLIFLTKAGKDKRMKQGYWLVRDRLGQVSTMRNDVFEAIGYEMVVYGEAV